MHMLTSIFLGHDDTVTTHDRADMDTSVIEVKSGDHDADDAGHVNFQNLYVRGTAAERADFLRRAGQALLEEAGRLRRAEVAERRLAADRSFAAAGF